MSEDPPDWKEIFKSQFLGASIESSRDETLLSLVGFDSNVITYLWRTYEVSVYIGKRQFIPLQLLWPSVELLVPNVARSNIYL